MTERRWVQVNKLNETRGSLIRTSTAYKWKHTGRFPELFKRVGRKLFLDLERLYELAEAGRLN